VSDIATLGLAIDSRQATAAATALDSFQRSANGAAMAADKITSSGAGSGKAVQALAGAAAPAAQAVNNLAKAANDNSKAHAGMSTQAMAAQHSIRSLIEAMASGQPISMALGQQLNHLSYAATGPGGLIGSFKQAGGALLGMLNPTTLVLAALGAIAVGGALVVHSLAETGKAFDDAAHKAGATTDQLHALATAAAFKGINNDEFLKGIDKFSASVYDAQHNMGGLADVMRANGKNASDFTGYMEKAADLIKNAASDQARLQLLQQMGLPATMDWVRFLSQGAAGIKEAIKAADDFNASAEGKLVAKAREFDQAWDKTWTNWTTRAKSAALSAATFFESTSLFDSFSKLANNTYGSKATDRAADSASKGAAFPAGVVTSAPLAPIGKPTVDPATIKNQISQAQQLLGLYGQTMTAEEAATQVDLAARMARANLLTVDQSRIDILKQLAREQTNGVAQIKAQTDAEKINAATVGMSAGATAQYTAYQNALNEAKRAGRTLTDADIASLKENSAALGQAAKNTDNLKFAFDNLVQGPLETFTAAIAQGKSAMDAFKAAGTSALNAIAKKLADIAAQNLWMAAFPGGGGGLGSLFFGSPGVSSSGAINGAVGPTSVNGAPLGFAGGGYTGHGAKFQPAGIVHKGEFVFDQSSTRRIGVANLYKSMRGYADGGMVGGAASASGDASNDNSGGGGNGSSAALHVVIDMNANGKWEAHVAKAATGAASDTVNAFAKSPNFVSHVATASTTARKHRLLK
jgi:lambda family phage tail tape measure protein